jgi:hypothetical protein
MQGDTKNPFSVQIRNTYDGEPVDVSDATISMTMQNVADPSDIKTCHGTWTKDPDDGSKFFYKYQPGDVNEPGSWKMRVKASFGSDPVHPDDGKGNFKILVILPLSEGA